MKGFLTSKQKSECNGCGACVQACPVQAMQLQADEEGFYYPHIDEEKCIHCERCVRLCPIGNPIEKHLGSIQRAWGGFYNSQEILSDSTSGGAFSAILKAWWKEGSVIFGAVQCSPTCIQHQAAFSLEEANVFRKSKYLQSQTGQTFQETGEYLSAGKRVLYSGTPCQIAGLKAFLGDDAASPNLLTVEVMCEGVPSPIFHQKYIHYLESKTGKRVSAVDWRDKNKNHWDFQFTKITYEDLSEQKISRWFNPFWSIWLSHLMSRPACYECCYTTRERVADLTLADLWGVHLYCPELYNRNRGSSLILCNSEPGQAVWNTAKQFMEGHDLDIQEVIRYQSPLRKQIEKNDLRSEFMEDVQVLDYQTLCRKYAKKPSLKLLWQKYVWGNRQKVWLWNFKQRFVRK